MQTTEKASMVWGRQVGPKTCPERYSEVCWAYLWGWQAGHGLACHNVPKIGKTYWSEWSGKTLCSEENAKDLHESLCFEAEMNGRQFSPFEQKAREMNEEVDTELAWEAYEEGVRESILADVSTYGVEEYQ